MNKLFVLISLLTVSVMGQTFQQDYQKIKSRYGYEIYRPAVVVFDYFWDYSERPEQQHLLASVAIQNDFLQFTRQQNSFTSKYQVTLAIRNEKTILFSKTWDHTQTLTDFKKTNSTRDFQFKSYEIHLEKEDTDPLEPGEYEMVLEVNDLLSQRHYKNKRTLVVEEISEKDSTIISTGIGFFSQNKNSQQLLSSTQKLVPFNSPYIAMAKIGGPQLAGLDSLSFNVRLYKKEEDAQNLLSQHHLKAPQKNGIFELRFELPFKAMDEGEYVLRFATEETADVHELEHTFNVLWLGKPLYLFKTDLAIRPLKYLLQKDEMEAVKSLRVEELDAWFTDFWKKRDPSPQTVYNELMDVYYQRVTEAVRKYSNRFKEGWQTDRGMIYLLYGKPEKIENRKYSVNSIPHIIWKYTVGEDEQVFTFIDKNKTGIFTLLENETGKN